VLLERGKSLDGIYILLPAFLAGFLIVCTHVPLGLEVMKRGIIFIDLALAQIAGLGVIVASLYFHSEENLIITQLMAFLFAISAAYGFMLFEKYTPKLQEAIIGSVYVFSSSLALLLLANHPHGAEEVQNLLSGQLLWISWQQIVMAAIAYILLIPAIFTKKVINRYFFFIFALTITISVQLSGVFFVFASLILPAIGAAFYKNKLVFGYSISIISLIIGLVVSLATDWPTGPILVCILFVIVTLFIIPHFIKLRILESK
tara:strand:+ start:1611 stop:2390 length:780 start_codon:yes stop_codon:yes gene_type:complete